MAKKKIPTLAGLKKAQENFKKLYKKQPSDRLVSIISDDTEKKEDRQDKIAASGRRRAGRSAEL